ncbi:MAG: hypothetical protein BroJett030_18380 [Alphaproteobacteria bacterium]|nr:MAG: hypothetical protein BroJett030_18380 [Alphaproteobacteria bacterium]
MEPGLLIALGVAAAIIVLAVVLTRLFRPRPDPHDLNASQADGRASATWIGIRASGDADHPQ